jgi:hypothetical protein
MTVGSRRRLSKLLVEKFLGRCRTRGVNHVGEWPWQRQREQGATAQEKLNGVPLKPERDRVHDVDV